MKIWHIVVESVNSFCEQNSVHGLLGQRVACANEEINGSQLYSRDQSTNNCHIYRIDCSQLSLTAFEPQAEVINHDLSFAQ